MLKIGIIGVGAMGKNHARICSELEDVELVGIADNNKTNAKKISEKFNIKAFLDYKELLPKIEAAIIATPTFTHHKIAMNLLNNGKHVLVEKPICDNVKKAEELVKEAEKENVTLAVGHIERHNPVVKFIKDALEKGSFGEIITITSKRVSKPYNRVKDVGVILDLGIHDIDVLQFIAGEIKSVYAKAGKFNRKINHEDHANIILNFKNEVTGVIEVNWLTPMKIRRLSLTCSENFVEADYINQSITISSSLFKQINEMDLYHLPIQYNVTQVALEKKEPLKNEIENFVDAVKKNKKPLATGEDGLMALKIAKASIESYKKGRVIKL